MHFPTYREQKKSKQNALEGEEEALREDYMAGGYRIWRF
ncbi:hypothetical protein A45J_0005 [hot springs metagenome]|uniref:Uncharacterized protein n=1 Tax=hot springs metagenome TaxID=433727 RepID=A0A5J4L0E5_9ZZZZ